MFYNVIDEDGRYIDTFDNYKDADEHAYYLYSESGGMYRYHVQKQSRSLKKSKMGRNNNKRNNNRNNNNQNEDYVKHSGCKKGMGKNNIPFVQGWKYNRRLGMRSFLAVPYGKTHRVKSNNGKDWENWMVKISQEGVKEQIVSGLYEVATGRVLIKELGYIMNPNARDGGYLGTYIKK